MPTAPQIDAPLTLCNFFPNDDSDEGEDQEDGATEESAWDPCYEVQSVELAGEKLQIRQFAFHSHNANRVWPGTFNLADYLLQTTEADGQQTYQHFWGSVLELGTATGLLAIRLALASIEHGPQRIRHEVVETQHDNVDPSTIISNACSYVVTSDVLDEQGDVEGNVAFNFALNGYTDATFRPLHIPHTWGTGWKDSVTRQLDMINISTQNGTRKVEDLLHFDTIVASDILLYVSAYDALVETLRELMPDEDSNVDDNLFDNSRRPTRFVMSWNRRMKESAEFFDKMKHAGFDVTHEGKCIYTFVRRPRPTEVQGATEAILIP